MILMSASLLQQKTNRKTSIQPNRLTRNQAVCGNNSSDTTGHRALGNATLEYVTNVLPREGMGGCIKVVTPGVAPDEGFDHNPSQTIVVNGETYTAYYLVKGPYGAQLRLTATGGLTGANFTLAGALPGGWDLLKITGTASATQLYLHLKTINSNQAITFYAGPAILRKGSK